MVWRLILFSGGVVAIGIGLGWGFMALKRPVGSQNCPVVDPTSEISPVPTSATRSSTPTKIAVDINGAVVKPGIYELEAGARYADLISLAGGLSKLVSKEFVAKELNLAKSLKDQDKVYLPFAGEKVSQPQSQSTPGSGSGSSSTTDSIPLNTATAKQLQTLKGVGEVTAQKIIDNRPFTNVSELLSKKIVGEKVYSDIAPQLSI